MSYKKSQFNHEVSLPGTKDTLIYNFRSHKFAKINWLQKIAFDTAPFENIPKGSFLEELLDFGMLVTGDELESLRAEVAENKEKHKVLHATVYVNMKCNFACEYCLETGQKSQEEMSPKTRKNTIRFIEQIAETEGAESIQIIWFGGEPLLSPEIIEEISSELISFADERGIKYAACIYTNGYALTEKNVHLLERCRVKTARISVDGIGDTNDKFRHLKDGGGTYDRIIENIKNTKTDIVYRIRCNLNRLNKDCYRDFVEEFKKIELESGNRTACAPERMKVEGNVRKELREIELSHNEYMKIYSGIKDCVVREEDSDVFNLQRNRPYACPACSKLGFVINASGKVFKCGWDPAECSDKTIADVNSFDGSFENTRHSDFFLDFTFPDRAKCRSCALLPVCLGRCPLNMLEDGKYSCHRLLNDLDWVVLKLYNELNQFNNTLTEDIIYD